MSLTSIDKATQGPMRSPEKKARIRFMVVGSVVVVLLSLIWVRTASLQLTRERATNVVETVGERHQMTVPAPRGDIVDRNGIPLAFNEQTRALYIANADLDNDRLNRMLFELDRCLLADGVDYQGDLPTYLDVASDAPDSDDQGGHGASVRFVFKRDAESMMAWQTRKTLFNMIDPRSTDVNKLSKRDQRRVAKSTPAQLFDYLLYDVFEIEHREAGASRLYTDREAFRIMKLRYTLFENNWLFQAGTPVRIVDDVSQNLERLIHDASYRFPGVLFENRYRRRYSAYSNYAGHAIGYIGAISSGEYARLKPFGYSMTSDVGKAGVELSAERYLRGVDGDRPYHVFVDDKAQVPSTPGTPPEPGAEVRLTLDIDLQKVVVDAMTRKMEELRHIKSEPDKPPILAKSASFVAMNPKTGAIYAIGSLPDYKVADFVDQAVDKKAAERVERYLTDTDTKPMLNRAISEVYAPGSTFKPVTSIAGLETGVITPSRNTYVCKGTEKIGGWVWSCLQYPIRGHGPLTLAEALQTSCNLYFYHLGIDTGIDSISTYGKQLGLGEYAGIDLPGEVKGIRPSREMKALLRTKPEDKTWFMADTCQTSIGQFDNNYSMLQMVRMISGLATGYLPRPHIIGSVVSADDTVVRAEQIERLPLNYKPDNLAAIRAGMVRVAMLEPGRTGYLFHDFPIKVAAKTGTAQVGYGKSQTINSVVIAYAPADDPEIAMACLVENGSYGEYISDVIYYAFCHHFGVTPKTLRPIRPLQTQGD